MTDVTRSVPTPAARREPKRRATSNDNIRRRYAKEKRFQAYGITAVSLAIAVLAILLIDIVSTGYSAFFQHRVALRVTLDPERLRLGGDHGEEALARASYRNVVRDAVREEFPDVTDRRERRELYGILSNGADLAVRNAVLEDPSIIGTTQTVWVKTSDDVDTFLKGRTTDIVRREPPGWARPIETEGKVTVSVESRDAFADILDGAKKRLNGLADKAEDELALLLDLIETHRKALEGYRTDPAGRKDDFARVRALLETDKAEAAKLSQRIDDLRRRAQTPDGPERLNDELPSYLVKINGGLVKIEDVSNSEIKGTALLPIDGERRARPGEWQIVSYVTPEADRRIGDREIAWIGRLQEKDRVEKAFDISFFRTGDSREPEIAGIRGAVVGSFFALVVTLLLSFPVGVLAATYLEEFAPKNRITDIIEVNINNLAAVPSIVFGLLGLAVFLNFFGLPRSAPLVGGMVLALMTLPTIIIAARSALKSVPPSIRQAALGLGASPIQTVVHHVLPLAMPGILTGTIIGLAQALGETAPLLMIGMIAFIVDIPGGVTDPATVLPVQIYLWSDSPERAFVAKTGAAIMVLLAFLITMNATAVLLRKRFERRW